MFLLVLLLLPFLPLHPLFLFLQPWLPPAKKPPGGLKRPASAAFAEAKAKVERNDSLREAMVGVSVKP